MIRLLDSRKKAEGKFLKNRHLFFPFCKLDGEKETGWSGEECFGVRVFRVLGSSLPPYKRTYRTQKHIFGKIHQTLRDEIEREIKKTMQ